MNARNLELAAQLVPETYVRQAADAIASRENAVKVLLSQVPFSRHDPASAPRELIFTSMRLNINSANYRK